MKISAISGSPHKNDVATPRRKVLDWLQDDVLSNPTCECCRKRKDLDNLNNTTRAIRTKALHNRLLLINKRRNPLQKRGAELVEKSLALRKKAQQLLQEAKTSTPIKPTLSLRTKLLQDRLLQMKKRVSSIRRKNEGFQIRSRQLMLKAQNVLDTSTASLADEKVHPSPLKKFQRNSDTRKVIRSRAKKTATFSDCNQSQPRSDLKTFVRDGLQCTLC